MGPKLKGIFIPVKLNNTIPTPNVYDHFTDPLHNRVVFYGNHTPEKCSETLVFSRWRRFTRTSSGTKRSFRLSFILPQCVAGLAYGVSARVRVRTVFLCF